MYSKHLVGVFSVMCLLVALPSHSKADDQLCPWNLDKSPEVASLKKMNVTIEFSCPAALNNPANSAATAKVRDFYAESLTAFSKEENLFGSLAKNDFLRVLRLAPQTINAPDYVPDTRVLTFGLYSNDAITYGNNAATRDDSISFLKNLASSWSALYKGRAVLPDNCTSNWGDRTRHQQMLNSLASSKSTVDASLAKLKNYAGMVRVIELRNFTAFSNGYLALDSNFVDGDANDILSMMRAYAKIPATIANRIAISCNCGNDTSFFLQAMALSSLFDKIGTRWGQIAIAAPKVRAINFNTLGNFPVGSFRYDSENKTVRMPVGASNVFMEDTFKESLDKLSNL